MSYITYLMSNQLKLMITSVLCIQTMWHIPNQKLKTCETKKPRNQQILLVMLENMHMPNTVL